MNQPPIMEVVGLEKTFKQYRSDFQRVLNWFFPVSTIGESRVLEDISFSIGQGEAVGIIGQNGAGKSTLLKMITGTLKPSAGHIQVHGRVSAILELGMGFNGDLTGRQNVMHSAALMGYTQRQIDQMMPDIEAFAEIGEYFDRPMRIYSSGMQMRVAFSIATASRPDILIVDEALSVGDAYFQHKSFDRIRQFQRQGTSLLIVSHDKEAIQTLCSRAILLEQGRVFSDGPPAEIMDYYTALIAQKENSNVKVRALDDGKVQTSSGTLEATIESVALYSANDDDDGQPLEWIAVGKPVTLCIKTRVHKEISRLVLGYAIKDRLGQTVFGTNSWHTGQVIEAPAPGDSIDYKIHFDMNLGPGSYSVSVSLHDTDTHLSENYHWIDYALVFSVANADKSFFIGTSWMMPTLDMERRPLQG